MNTIRGYHDKNSKVAGSWNIIDSICLLGSCEPTGIEGTEFTLTESGDVEWRVKEGVQHLPLFDCPIFELYTYQNVQCYVNKSLIRFIGYKGHIIEFRLDQPVMSEDLMLLSYDGWFMLQCEKLPSPKVEVYHPYSLLPALQDEFFTDLRIISKSNRVFPCHAVILEASFPALDWKGSEDPLMPLSLLDDDVIETVLYYVYARALPPRLLLASARKCINLTAQFTDLEDFRNDCLIYGKNINFRNNFIGIVHAVHESLENIRRIFSSSLTPSPPQTIHNLKAALRYLAVGVVKVLEACMECEKADEILILSEQNELMMYIRNHVPLLLSKVIEILKCIKNTLVSMTTHMRQELATQLVPEIHSAFQTILKDLKTIWKGLEEIVLDSMLFVDVLHAREDMSLSCTLGHDLQLRELQKLRILQENLISLSNSILFKKEQFEEIESSSRIRGVARMLELITDELPDLTQRLQDFLHAMDDLFDMSEFKFVFKGVTSKIRRIVEKLCLLPCIIEGLIQDLCERVKLVTFTETLTQLGFIRKPESDEKTSPSKEKGPKRGSTHSKKPNSKSSKSQTSSDGTSAASFHSSPSPSSAAKTSRPILAGAANFSSLPVSAENALHADVRSAISSLSLSEKCSCEKGCTCKHKTKKKPAFEPPLSYRDSPDQRPVEENDEFSIEEFAPHLLEESKKLNLVKRVCSVPCGSKSKLASCILPYLDSDQHKDMTFVVIPPPDEEDVVSNSSCETLSSDSISKDTNSKSKEEENLTAYDNVNIHKGDSPLSRFPASRRVPRRVKKSFSLDRPSNISSSRSFSNNANNNDAGSQESSIDSRHHRLSSSKQSLSLDAGSVYLSSSSSANGEDSVDRTNVSRRIFSTDSYDSSTNYEMDNVAKGSDNSAFDSPSLPLESSSYPYAELKNSPYRSVDNSEVKVRGSIELKAHRVIMAARCEWFKRALLSGMREAIDRRIEVPGVSFPMFKLFMAYLYGGKVDLANLRIDELADLLILVDHYGIDPLKTLTEQCLETKVDDDSSEPLLLVAYHCNATKLKDICLQYCALKKNSYAMMKRLPKELRQQLLSTISSLKVWHRHGLEEGLIEFNGSRDNLCDGDWDSPTSLDPLIDDESSSVMTGMQDSGTSSEESFCLASNQR